MRNAFLIIFITSFWTISTTSQGQNPVKPAGMGIAEIEDVVVFNSIRKVVPGKPWSQVVRNYDVSNYSKIIFNYAEFTEFTIDRIEVLRKADKHFFTLVKVSGKNNCRWLLEDSFNVFGSLRNPKVQTKNRLVFEWNVDDNLADQNVTYTLNNKRDCEIRMQVNY